jgi:ribosomal protein S18 acetylase RimI-like enzyme
VNILLADVKDAEAILALQKICYQSEAAIYNDYSIQPLTETVDEITEEFERQVFLKATIENEIIGSVRAYAEGETCYIGKLVVHPNHQNQGLGKKLLLSIESVYMSIRRFELFTGDRSEKNLTLYRKLDYKEFNRVHVNEKLTLVYLEKLV